MTSEDVTPKLSPKFKELVKIMVEADIKNLEEMKQCQDVIRKLSNNKKYAQTEILSW